MTLRHFFQNVPNFLRLAFDHFLRAANGVNIAEFFQSANDERLEQNERHLLRQTALMQLEFRPNDDDRSAGIIHALAEQVLTEASAFALEHVAQRFQRAVARAGDRTSVTAVVEQRVHGFLQHTLLVADDDFGRLELEQRLETVVAVDDTAVKIVQIRSRKTSAFERHQRAQVRRNHRQHREDHPFRTALRRTETLQQLDALRQFFADLLALGFRHRDSQFLGLLDEINTAQGLANRFRPHLGGEGFGAVSFARFAEFDFREQLMRLQRRRAGINHKISLIINHAFQMARGHVQREADARGHALERPDVLHGHGEFDVAHAFTANAGQSHLDAATVADDAAMLDAFVFAAGTFPVLDGTENAFAEKAALFRLERAVVDGFRIFDFALAPRANGVRRGERDADVVNLVDLVEAEQLTGVFFGTGHTILFQQRFSQFF